jgi:hypothetical protein
MELSPAATERGAETTAAPKARDLATPTEMNYQAPRLPPVDSQELEPSAMRSEPAAAAALAEPAAVYAAGVKTEGAAAKGSAKRKAARGSTLEDEECSIDEDATASATASAVPAAKRHAPGAVSAAPAASAAAAADDDDDDADEDDVVLTGSTGPNSLIDFPHSRSNCGSQPFVPGNFAQTCANCYCYVCDAPASGCAQWAQHCVAFAGDEVWRKERARLQAAARVAATAPAAAAAAAAGGGATAVLTVSCDNLMKQVEQVYPLETSTTLLASGIQLRPYQRQSLAFMLDLERAPAGASTIGTVYRSIYTPGDAHQTFEVRGGWLTDEVGMGKTAVCIAVVLENPLKPALQTKTNLKTTLIITKNSLLGQWQDELRKYAPQLKIACFHSETDKDSFRDIKSGRLDLNKIDIDILLGTPGTFLPQYLIQSAHFHRVIIDEAHEVSNTQVQKIPQSSFRWAVTGTPMTKALTDLEHQARFLGFGKLNNLTRQNSKRRGIVTLQTKETWHDNPHDQLAISKTITSISNSFIGSWSGRMGHARSPVSAAQIQQRQADFALLISRLKQVMIRHTKSQRIAGDIALALPELDSETVFLRMTAAERSSPLPDYGQMSTYSEARSTDMRPNKFHNARLKGTNIFSATMVLANQIRVLSQLETKLSALTTDLSALRRTNKHLHAVVYTQSHAAHSEICKRVRSAGFQVYELSGQTKVTDR